MDTARRTFVATGTVAVLAAAGVTAAIAADPAPAPPPKIAFLANGIVPADALAAGPIAGQLGAPMYTTQPDTLSSAAATGLGDYDPELVIVLGGPVAIHDTVITQVENATGLGFTDDVTPAGGIVRAAGGDRFDTAAAVADLLAAYNPAYLPINMQAIDADKLDGKGSSDFLAADGKAQSAGHADNADTLDGQDSTEFLSAAGPITVSSLNWRNNRGADFEITQVAAQTQIGDGSSDWYVSLNPDLPTSLTGNALALQGVDICLQSGGDRINGVEVYVGDVNDGTLGSRSEVLYLDETWDQGGAGCQTYAPSTPAPTGADSTVSLALDLDSTGDPVRINRTTFSLVVDSDS